MPRKPNRYEVWCGDVCVFASDVDADVRVLVDQHEVFTLAAQIEWNEPEEPGAKPTPKAFVAEAHATDEKGRKARLVGKKWAFGLQEEPLP